MADVSKLIETEQVHLTVLPTHITEISFIAEDAPGCERGFAVWNETYADVVGVYPTMLEAKSNLIAYCEYLSYKALEEESHG